jgi:hypothetical protein
LLEFELFDAFDLVLLLGFVTASIKVPLRICSFRSFHLDRFLGGRGGSDALSDAIAPSINMGFVKVRLLSLGLPGFIEYAKSSILMSVIGDIGSSVAS